jgi:hypothetical protein
MPNETAQPLRPTSNNDDCQHLPALELLDDLFARKFDDVAEPFIKNYIDLIRAKEEERLKQESEMMKEAKDKNETEPDWKFQGEGVMIVAKETIRDNMPLCMGLGFE